MATSEQHRVVIIGGGFGGLQAAKALRKAPVEVTLIDRRNHHVFQPLLYQVATGGLSPADISGPIRGLLAKQKNTRVLLSEVTGIDAEKKELRTSTGTVPYDTLVVATGASHSYFGKNEWAEFAPGLKTLDDATGIRRKVLLAFEAAEHVRTEEERRALLTFVIVGGGPTGVELAGAIGELARQTLRKDFRSFDPTSARVILIEAGPRILGTYTASLSPKAEKSLTKLGVEVRTGSLVTAIDDDGVRVRKGDSAAEEIASKTVLWAAGVQASPLGKAVADATGVPLDRVGRIAVEPDMSVPGHPEIFVVGDLSSYSHQTGQPLRGTADVAIAEGKYVGKVISARLKGKFDAKPFHFRDLGKLAVIGRSAAVADLRFIRFNGYLAWQAWLFIHILKLVGYQNRATVLVQWAWCYFTRKRSARLITGATDWEELAPESKKESEERRTSVNEDSAAA